MQDNQSPELFGQTPWQTVGPFFHYALTWHGAADLVGSSDLGARPDLFAPEHDVLARPRDRPPVPGRPIEVHGRVLDGTGLPVPDAMIETWQAGPSGALGAGATPGFLGFARSATSEDGTWRIRTVLPGAIADGGKLYAPSLVIGVMGRGLLKRLVTRAYFASGAENAGDPILAAVPEQRRATLMATEDAGGWRFDIILQGVSETVFFDV